MRLFLVFCPAFLFCAVFSAHAEERRRPEQTNSIGLRLVELPAGEFQMGGGEPAESVAKTFEEYGRKPEYFADEYPQHRVRITKPFLLGKYEVTVGQFRRFLSETGYQVESVRDGTGAWGYSPDLQQCEGRKTGYAWDKPGFDQTDDHPVLNVTWNDAVAFCDWLSKKEGRRYRLPTEAEWEYACRGGTTTRYNFGDSPDAIARQSRTLDPAVSNIKQHVQEITIPKDGSIPFTSPVGKFPPNDFGLHDMHGNAWEWTADWYGEDYYAKSAVDDPTGPTEGNRRVRRGGGWNSFPLWARASFRNWNTAASRCVNLGFRVAADLPTDEKAVSLIFVGDIMLDGGPGHVVASGKDPFEHCTALLRDADFTIGNLECVLGRGGEQILKAYSFRAASDSPRSLKKHFSALSVANNHSGDFGPEGMAEQLRILEEERIPYFGGGRTLAAARKPLILEKNGLKIALLGYNAFRPENYAATDAAAGNAPMYADLVLEDIREAKKQADIVLPYVHWGPELTAEPRPSQAAFARQMIDAGASAVIGSHPHVTQTVELHKGVPIIYSLGNFVFDYFPVDPPEWTGWIVKLTFRPGERTPDMQMHAVTLDPAGVPHPVELDDPGLPAPKPPRDEP
jgi:sulfatase modifying factor 1